MIYYPLSVLMLAGIREVLIITSPEDQPLFRRCSGDGASGGFRLATPSSRSRKGWRRPSSSGEEFVGDVTARGARRQHLLRPRPAGNPAPARARATAGATVFGYQVADPERYGVVAFDHAGTATSTDSLLEASEFVATLERRQGLKVCCPEEIALRMGYVTTRELKSWLSELGKGSYADYVRKMIGPSGT